MTATGWAGRWWRGGAVAAVAAAFVLGGAGLAARAGDDVRYVALGDSYTAGPGIPARSADPAGCGRSDHDYPAITAAALGLVLRDVSCGGATTEDLWAPQPVPGGPNVPQLAALDDTADVVTVGIGGNDIGFAKIVQACVAVAPVGQPCQDRFVGPAGDEVSRRIRATGPKVAVVLEEIRRRAPTARIHLVGYPAILPEQGPGCWPVMPFAPADVPYLRAKQRELNGMLAGEAAAAGAAYVDTYTPSIGHDACALPLLRWIEPVVPLAAAAPVHPSATGMRGMARAVTAAIGSPASAPQAGLRLELG